MKIQIVSDLHLERAYQELPGGEVLVLAGDIAEAKDIFNHHHSTKIIQDTPDVYYRCSEFFKWECAKYDRVFYVMGNHEHYNNRLDKTRKMLESVVPKNVTILEKEAAEYNGVLFLGGTLWTDCNRGDPMTFWHLKQMMSDYRCIKIHNKDKNLFSKLFPQYTVGEHRKTLEFFKTMLSTKRDMPAVIITHHGPTYSSIDDAFKNDHLMNGGYVSDLSDFILDNENIKLWCHGHVHISKDYMVGNTRVICNPRGYVGFDSKYSNFNDNLIVNLEV